MDLDVSDIVQQIKQSMFWMVHASHIRLDSLCGILQWRRKMIYSRGADNVAG